MNNLWVNSISIFGFNIKFYGIIIACGFLVALLLCIRFCKIKKMEDGIPYDLLLIVFPLAIIGARIYYVLSTPEKNWTFNSIIAIWNGGLGIFGGIILSLVGIIIYCIIKKYDILKVLDVIVPGLLIAQAMGRWGNFFNQECYGNLITNPSFQWFPFAVYIPSDKFTNEALDQVISYYGSADGILGAYFNATFFYESLWNFVGFVATYYLITRREDVGLCTAFYLFYEGVGRYWIEGLRTDSLYIVGTAIKKSQLVSIIMVLAGIVIFLYIYKKKKNMLDNKEKPIENTETN